MQRNTDYLFTAKRLRTHIDPMTPSRIIVSSANLHLLLGQSQHLTKYKVCWLGRPCSGTLEYNSQGWIRKKRVRLDEQKDELWNSSSITPDWNPHLIYRQPPLCQCRAIKHFHGQAARRRVAYCPQSCGGRSCIYCQLIFNRNFTT